MCFGSGPWLRLAAVAVALAGCASSGSSDDDRLVLGLTYRPTSEVDRSHLQAAAPIPTTVRVWINPITDVHPEGSQIGISEEEDNAPVYFGPGGLPPADFVRSALVQVLPALGVPVASEHTSATHVLEIRMTRFWTVEDNVYQASIVAHLALADHAGNAVWQAELQGANKRWGRSFNKDQYLHVFSDAALDLGTRLALDPAFRGSLSTGG